MPFPSSATTVVTTRDRVNTNISTQLNSNNDTPDTQATVGTDVGEVRVVVGEKKIPCHDSDTLFVKQKDLTQQVQIINNPRGGDKAKYYQELINNYITEIQSKFSNYPTQGAGIKLLTLINNLTYKRIDKIFIHYIPGDQPKGLEVFLKKLTLFTEASAEAVYYKDYKDYKTHVVHNIFYSCFMHNEKNFKIESIKTFMQQTDEQIIKTAQDKEMFTFILQYNYSKQFSQDVIDQKLQDNLSYIRHAELERQYPKFLDEFKIICKQKKIFIHYTFVNILKHILSFRDLSVDEILEKILYFFNCIDDKNPYIDTSIIYRLFGFCTCASVTKKRLSAILNLSFSTLEQIAKNPQLMEHVQQCIDGVFSLTEQQLEDKNIIAKSQDDHNTKIDNLFSEGVIATSRELVTEKQQVYNIENPKASVESKQSYEFTLIEQIEEVINGCHRDKAKILDDLNITILSTCMLKGISVDDGLLDIFRALSKKYISCKDAESISNKLRLVVKNLPDNIKIDNTSFLKIICDNGTGYINGLLALKELAVDEIIEIIKRTIILNIFTETDNLFIDLTEYSQEKLDDESDNTPALTREISVHNKRSLASDNDCLINYKKLKTSE